MTDRATLEQLLSFDHEHRHLEVKGPGSLANKNYVGRVARAAMAMGNLRDGGLVCLGVSDGQIAAMKPGLDPSQVAEWSDFDNVSSALARYSDPPVSLELRTFTLTSGAAVVLLEISEFEADVHICKKSLQGVLTDGHTYVRPRGQPRSVHVPTSAEMRELLNLAVDKGVREFVRRAGTAQVSLTGARTADQVEEAAFNHERARAWANPSAVDAPPAEVLIPGLRTAAFSEVSVRPGPYQSDRLKPGELTRFVDEQAVHLRGWPVPYISGRVPIQRHGDWIGQDLQSVPVPHAESWRLFTSGHFLQRRVLATDLNDAEQIQALDDGATGSVAVWDVLLYVVEVAELGARMATRLGARTVTFDVALDRISGRELVSGERSRPLSGSYQVAAQTLGTVRQVAVADLLADARGVGVGMAHDILGQFGLEVPAQVLRDYQDRVLGD